MANQKISTTDLDFDSIKANLKTFMQGQSQFSDYNFDGSALNILLDVLAYNTHYNALYTNLAINEAFLDSASKRSSVVSKAKELGYVPTSATGSVATVNVVFGADQLNPLPFIELPKYTPFSSSLNSTTYTFYTTESAIALLNNGSYTFSNIKVKEGTPLTFKYNVADGARYLIPNANVDLSTLTVKVQDNTEYTPYIRGDYLISATGDSTIYSVKEIDNQLYELEFGDGNIGKALNIGNIVNVEYMTCNGSMPNGATVFSYNGTSLTSSAPVVTTVSAAVNGSDIESISSIKWNAPRQYTSQNRCVTSEDYKTIITSTFPGLKSVSVWGGEENTPPQYGKVFIAAVPNSPATYLTTDQKNYILNNIVNPRKPLSVTPVFVDPTYINVQLDVSFYYNPQLTSRKAGDISTLVQQTVTNYNDTYLNTFGSVLKYSKLSSLIDQSEASITSNITTIKLHQEVTPIYNVVSGYIVNFNNPIYDSGVPEESVMSTGFYTTDSSNVCYIDDFPNEGTGSGVLRLFYYSGGSKVIVRNCGTVDYVGGSVVIENLNITDVYATSFKLVVKPQSNDVASVQHQFVKIDPSLTTINAVIDLPSRSYTFTSSRN